jgi:hypothetical protein
VSLHDLIQKIGRPAQLLDFGNPNRLANVTSLPARRGEGCRLW